MQGNKEPILLVEDEALIRMMLVGELEDAGFVVHEAGSGDEAVTLLEGGLEVALVVTDVRMPGRLDGLGLAAWLADQRPGLPVVIASGYATRPETEWLNPAVAAVLPKPYDPADVVGLAVGLLVKHPA
ncbi:response regulator [Rubellimicrobium mesophilum]|uniref:response regulator n=1 Tax=Rubellimicrobium mesophilum TaxID=1123067 RepID=UPI00055A2378|nr:response regulator [Rubellimicrobium mesophilum]